MQENKTQIAVIVVCLLLAGLVLSPRKPAWMPSIIKDAEIEKGIDLAGGAELRYRALFKPEYKGDKTADLQKIQHVLENRFRSARGALLEPRITPAGDDQIILQMPGIDRDKLDDYKKLVTQIGKLELKEVASDDIHREFKISQVAPAGYERYHPKAGGDDVLVKAESVITGDDIADAAPEPETDFRRAGGLGWHVRFELQPLGAKKFDEVAKRLFALEPHGKIAIIIDGQLDAVPQVNAAQFDGKGVIQGNYDEEGARRLAIVLKSGSLPVEIGRIGENKIFVLKDPEAENFVGPSLGQDSIQRGLWACLVALIGVAIFMLLYYRAGGIIAVVGLVINLLFLLALMALFKATMTLPGIAGIVLTIGMALDANILVLERIREEMLRGKTALQAFEAGYHRAFSTIMDANLTTLVAAVVMYYFGTGAIQGFAVTLSLGILTTLISVLWCCKVFQRALVQNGTITQWKMALFFKTPHVDFVRLARPAVILSAIVMALSVFIFVQRGPSQFGIDLKGGSMLHVSFAERQDITNVRSTVASIKTNVGGSEVEKYPDAEIQTVAQAGQGWKSVSGIAQKEAFEFQMRTVNPELDQVKADLQTAFRGRLSHVPFEDTADFVPNDREFDGRGRGAALNLYFRDSPEYSLQKIDEEAAKELKDVLDKDANGRPFFLLEPLADAPPGLKKAQLIISKPDAMRLTEAKERFRTLGKSGKIPLSRDPFVSSERVHAAVATEMQNSAAWAMIWSWSLMIVYVAFRFSRMAFGVAAVIALIHDAVIAIGFTSLAGWLVPKSWGLSFEMNMNTVAAVLTIIGFSINDTIVTFDRMRENFGLMKKESLKEIINASVNQTLSRTILTAFTVWVTCLVLYFFTMTSGGGIASFAFPLLMGVLVGSYSTVYIAAPILMWWFKGKRPETA
ncbi:MAG TPA: protein translocase subunit SecD [Planctomycetota bacterium]|nr:protein translocase subunit SecD [Planctomycetota bacterium]